MKLRGSALSLFTALVCTSAFAVTVGHVQTGATAFFSSPTGVITSINTAYPAPEAGTVSTVTLLWGNAPAGGCANVFKVKFFRLTSPFGFTLVATRGPFSANNGSNTVTLSPSVNVITGDMIGITQLFNCGGASHAQAEDAVIGFTTNTDPSGAVTGLNMTRGLFLATRASSAVEVVAGHLPLVAGGGGIGGTFQRTGLQLANLDSTSISGRLVFHPMFASATPGDPSITYLIGPGQTLSSDDILSLMGVTTSGSMDIMVSSTAAPRTTTRIYKDTGPGTGTLGDHEELEHPQQSVLGLSDRATINTPTSLTNFAFNIGVRTFASGATISVHATSATGALVVPLFTKTYAANYTEEVSASTFLGGFVPENGTININVTGGSLLMYGLVTDTTTGDANFRRFTRK